MNERDAGWERQHLYRVMFDDLKICGCNEPWAAYGLMRDLLVYFAQDHADRDYGDLGRLIGTDGAIHLVLCQLDNAHLIEHGGTVAGAWLTDRGRAVLEMSRRHEWEGVDDAGYPHDGQDCAKPCWIPQQPAPPEPSTAERMEAVRKAAAEQRAAMTPVQRLLDDAATDMMLYGEATIPVGVGTVLGEFLRPTLASSQPGAPWTHTFNAKAPCDLDGCCETDGPCACDCHKTQPTHTIDLLDEVLAKRPDGEEIIRVVTGSRARAAIGYSRALDPRPAPRPAQFLDGCRQVAGTWVHGRREGAHTCPKWARG